MAEAEFDDGFLSGGLKAGAFGSERGFGFDCLGTVDDFGSMGVRRGGRVCLRASTLGLPEVRFEGGVCRGDSTLGTFGVLGENRVSGLPGVRVSGGVRLGDSTLGTFGVLGVFLVSGLIGVRVAGRVRIGDSTLGSFEVLGLSLISGLPGVRVEGGVRFGGSTLGVPGVSLVSGLPGVRVEGSVRFGGSTLGSFRFPGVGLVLGTGVFTPGSGPVSFFPLGNLGFDGVVPGVRVEGVFGSMTRFPPV